MVNACQLGSCGRNWFSKKGGASGGDIHGNTCANVDEGSFIDVCFFLGSSGTLPIALALAVPLPFFPWILPSFRKTAQNLRTDGWLERRMVNTNGD